MKVLTEASRTPSPTRHSYAFCDQTRWAKAGGSSFFSFRGETRCLQNIRCMKRYWNQHTVVIQSDTVIYRCYGFVVFCLDMFVSIFDCGYSHCYHTDQCHRQSGSCTFLVVFTIRCGLCVAVLGSCFISCLDAALRTPRSKGQNSFLAAIV